MKTQTCLEKSGIYKVPEEDGLNVELFKYACELYKRRFLQFLDAIWHDGKLRESWHKDTVIAIKKERYKTHKYITETLAY
jgi:hypothetical protein